VGARRCPNCRAPTSWRSRLRSNLLPFLVLVLFALIALYAALYVWPEQKVTGIRRQESGLPAPAAFSDQPGSGANTLLQASAPPGPLNQAGLGAINERQTFALPIPAEVTALKQRHTEETGAVTVRGRRVELGMNADSLFELVSARDLIGQSMEPDPGNPADLKFTKYYRIDQNEFAIELRKFSRTAPYTVSSILVKNTGKTASAKR
jgi:hypothetical protein